MRLPLPLSPCVRCACLVLALGQVASLARAQSADPKFWIPNDVVQTMVRSGNKLYLGGNFTYVGPGVVSGCETLDPATGYLTGSFPAVNGWAEVAISDGAGGWYLGGSFSAVGDSARAGLAHVLANGAIAAWNPNPDGDVTALTLSGSTLYVGGNFYNIGGQARTNLAALSTATGLATAWDPEPDGTVHAILVHASTLYVGGSFANVGADARAYVAAIDATTGLASNWDPEPDSDVFTLLDNGPSLVVGGQFTQFAGQGRSGLAAVAFANGALTSWAPGAGPAYALVKSAGRIYVGGLFQYIGGAYRANLAALDSATALATAWNPSVVGAVSSLAVAGNTVYVGGTFTNVAGQPYLDLCAVDATTGAVTPTWVTSADLSVSSIVYDGTHLLVAGEFQQVGGVQRNFAAAIDLTTGRATRWNPNVTDDNAVVKSLALSNGTLYAGGSFQHIGGQARNSIAALDTLTGAATAWDPNADNSVIVLTVAGSNVIATGAFTHMGGLARAGLAAVDMASGAPTSFNPGVAGGGIYALAVSGSTLYAGGTFSSLGGLARAGIGAIDLVAGTTTSWNPTCTGAAPYVFAIVPSASGVYTGGEFTGIGGQSRSAIARVSATTGLADGWNPSATGGGIYGVNGVFSILPSGSNVYLGGQYTAVGGQTRNNLAAVNATSGAPGSWNPNADLSVLELAEANGTVLAGGTFLHIGGLAKRYVAALPGSATTAVGPTALPGRVLLVAGPNPAHERLGLHFDLPEASRVTIGLFDLEGRKAAGLADGALLPAGHHDVALPVSSLAPGEYFARLETNGQHVSTRFVVTR